MSKVGRLPIKIPEHVSVEVEGETVKIAGPRGMLLGQIPKEIAVEKKDDKIFLINKKRTKHAKALHGTFRAIIANMVKGVSEGWTKYLELVGAGYRAEVTGDTLSLAVGYSHLVKIKPPQGVSFKVEKTVITIEGIDKCVVGQIAAQIRSVRPPEPYKGKGIKYKDEIIRRKAGKAAKAQGVPA